MTKIHESIVRNADSIVYLLEIIKKLEERIISLERELDRSNGHLSESCLDHWYWDH